MTLPRTELADLQQYAALQQRVEARINEDAATLEDILVRTAGPTLQRIEEDCNTLDTIRQQLAQPPLRRLGQDAKTLTKIARKLSAPTVDRIAEDQAVLTGIAARANSNPFPSVASGPAVYGGGANPGALGTSQQSRPTGFAGTPASPTNVGNPGAAPTLAASAGIPTDTLEESPGLPGVFNAISLPGQPTLAASVSVPSSPFAPPPVSAALPPAPKQEPDLTVTSGASGGGTVALGGGREPPPFPAPPPPLPPPVADQTDSTAAILRCCSAIADQLAAIAQALYALRPDVRRAQEQVSANNSSLSPGADWLWDDPPLQSELDPDEREPAARETDFAALLRRISPF